MNFGTAERIQATIAEGDEAARVQGDNRLRVNNLFNGFPPLSDEEARKANIRINTNWGEAAVLGQHGKRQYRSAFLSTKNFFRINLPNAPVAKQKAWEIFMTGAINRPLKRSKKYYHVHKYKWSTVLIHGVGPTLWYDDEDWCPDFIALADLRIPTDTTTDFENLNWFAVRHAYTVGELARKVWGPNADPHWAKEPIQKLLNEKKDINYDNNNAYDWMTQPEKMAELVKQNGIYYESDAVPTIPLWNFYYLDEEKLSERSWKKTVVPDVQSGATVSQGNEFLYVNEKPVARDLGQLLHCQFGDLNVDMPAKYHSVRALGFELMEPCFYTNLTRCRFLQHVHESFNIWLRVQDPQGKARAQKIELYDRAIIPEGVSIVPQDQRHQIQPALVEGVLSELRQLMSEAAVSYTQDVHEPGSQEETATKTMAKVQQVNALLGGLLDDAFQQEVSSYEEIGRRMCLRKSRNADAKKFQQACLSYGIPPIYLNVEQWEIEPEMPLGNGNATMAMAEAQQIMSVRPMLSPTAQQEALHQFIEVTTNNPRLADRWVPLEQGQGITNAQERAESIFGTLMQGVPARLKEGLNPIEVIETLLGMMAGVISRIERMGNMATAGEVAGLQTTAQYVGQLIGQLAQNRQEKPRVKQFSDSLGKLLNIVKGFQQRLAEQQGDPEAAAKIQALQQTTQAKLQGKQMADAQKLAHKEQAFRSKEQQQNAKLLGDQQRENFKAGAEMGRETVKTRAEVARRKYAAYSNSGTGEE